MKKKFGIDIDGTITRPDTIVPYLNTDFGLSLTFEDITTYDLSVIVGRNEDEFSKWWLSMEEIVYKESLIVEGAKKILLDWKDKYDLYFISARSKHLLKVTKEWFEKQGLSSNQIDLIGSHDKVSTINKYNIEIFFEDKHDNAIMIHESCNIPVILFDTPYNQSPIPNGVYRVKNWSEANEWVKVWMENKNA